MEQTNSWKLQPEECSLISLQNTVQLLTFEACWTRVKHMHVYYKNCFENSVAYTCCLCFRVIEDTRVPGAIAGFLVSGSKVTR